MNWIWSAICSGVFMRHRLLQGAWGFALVSRVSTLAMLRTQTVDLIRISHLPSRTGFLGSLGEYGDTADDLAQEEINCQRWHAPLCCAQYVSRLWQYRNSSSRRDTAQTS